MFSNTRSTFAEGQTSITNVHSVIQLVETKVKIKMLTSVARFKAKIICFDRLKYRWIKHL